VNAEKAFETLRAVFPSPDSVPIAYHRRGISDESQTRAPDGWGGVGLPPGRPPDWTAIEPPRSRT